MSHPEKENAVETVAKIMREELLDVVKKHSKDTLKLNKEMQAIISGYMAEIHSRLHLVQIMDEVVKARQQ
jgi:pyridoxal/pyridoxine/pyridoxamine kinase